MENYQLPKTRVLVDSHHGVYVPQLFARCYAEEFSLRAADIAVLEAGPDHPDYWEAWDSVLDSSERVDMLGHKWRLYLTDNGDLLEVRDDYEWDDL